MIKPEDRQPCITFLGCDRFLDAAAYGAPGECAFLDNKGNCCHVHGPKPIFDTSGLETSRFK